MQMILPFDYGTRRNGVRRTCAVDECVGVVYGHGYCGKHYNRSKRYGDPYTTKKSANGTHSGQSCKLEGCDEPAKLVGYCNTHGLRFKRHGDPLKTLKIRSYAPTDVCAGDGCTAAPRNHGYCPTHWARVKSNGDPEVTQRTASWAGIACKQPGCKSGASSKGWCRSHYIQHNMDMFLHYSRTRRAAKLRATVIPYTRQQVLDKCAYWGNKCWMCGDHATTVDHVKPLSRGGLDCISNFRPACRSCNSSKRAKWFGVANLHRFIKTT